MKTTNIYYILDCSHKMQGGKLSSMSQNVLKVARALKFAGGKTNLHIITYRDKAKISSPFSKLSAFGNPNLAEGLKALESAIRYQRKIDNEQTRSIFILHASDNVLQGWNKPLERLFNLREFAFGHRYVVQYGTPDKYAKQAFTRFTDSTEKILHYFSEGRLCSLVRNTQ
ncbi:MAG: VWA domain-containing protein [Clostridia bacterium]|nr:VWA domain-containing protein [Clostridia bacterium]